MGKGGNHSEIISLSPGLASSTASTPCLEAGNAARLTQL